MTNIAWKNLARERTRFILSIGGVAFAVLLILILRGLYWGIAAEATEYVRTAEADLWVAQAGAPVDFIHSMSLQPSERGTAIAAVEGVAAVAPLLARPVTFRSEGRNADIFLLGVDPRTAMGWPPAGVEADKIAGPGEIVVDRVFAVNSEVAPGDVLDIRGTRLRVAGVVRGGNALVYQFGWANLPEVADLVQAHGFVSYFLVQTAEGDPDAVSRRIEQQVPGTQVLSGAQFAHENSVILRQGFLPVLWVLMLIAIAVGVAVIGLVIYTATVEKSSEYAVLKAIGFSNRRLYRIVFQQSLIAAVGGFGVGVALSFGLGALLPRLVPVFVTAIGPGDVAFAAGSTVVMALASSFVPTRPVARLDPARSFRA
ncbi:MAG: ABC transporter permease [Actinomycetota bacterium]|nr:ABC transporter permease [Actinomycetota bacterium]